MLISYAISDFTAAQHETQRIGKENIVQPTPIGLIWFQPRTVAVVAIASLFPLLTSTIDSLYTTELLHNNNHLQRVISWLHNNNHLRFSSNMQLRHRFRRRETLTRRRKVAEIVNHLLIALRVWKNFSRNSFLFILRKISSSSSHPKSNTRTNSFALGSRHAWLELRIRSLLK